MTTRNMHWPSCWLCLLMIPMISATYTVQMAVSLNGLSDLTTPQRDSFKLAVATTALVGVDKISIIGVTASASAVVNFEINVQDYETASDVGIRLDATYLSEDLSSNGLPVATIVSGPSFENNDYQMISCLSCEEGQYLDTTCQECPQFSHTLPRVNAPDISHCMCDPGYKPPAASASFNLVVSGGKYRLSVDGEERPELHMFRGRRTTVTWPTSPFSHPFTISETSEYDAAPYAFSSVGSGETTIDIAADFAGDKLYYYCSEHSGMLVGEILVVDDECSPCGVGFFKGQLANVSCTICPTNSSTAIDNAVELSQCLCNPGFFRNNGECQECQAGKFKSDLSDAACTDCTSNSDSPANSILSTDCICNLGYIGPDGGPCVACVPGKYRSGADTSICEDCEPGFYNVLDAATSVDACLQCPLNTHTAGSGSGSSLDCTCNAGFSASKADTDTAWTCDACTAGFYSLVSNSSECTACGPGTYSITQAASTADVCTECADGKYNVDTGRTECLFCPANTWQDTSAASAKSTPCEPCPASSSHSDVGVTDVNICICGPGVYKVVQTDLFTCEDCTAGDYCLGDNIRRECAVNFYSLAGASQCSECAANSQAIVSVGLISPGQCQCVLGYEGTSHDSCSACVEGKYQPDDYTYDSTQTALRDGISITNETMAVEVTCVNCAADLYADTTGVSVCTDCPVNTNTGGGEGSTDVTDCVCSASYFGPNGGPCELCPVGRFCPGGTNTQPCRAHSNSSVGSSAQEDCKCNPGWYSSAPGLTCQKCVPDSYCPGDQAVVACSDNSFSPAGSSSITQCWCNEGMWRGCIITADGDTLDGDGVPCTIDYTLACFDCDANDICVNNTMEHCMEHAVAPVGSHEIEACVCVDGYYNVNSPSGDRVYELVAHLGKYYLAADTSFSSPNPTLQATRGHRTEVIWPYSQSGGSHPFFVSESPGHGAPQSALADTQTGLTVIDIPEDYTGDLYYYCQLHSSMVGAFEVIEQDHSG